MRFSQPDILSVHPAFVNSSTLHMHGVYTAFVHLAVVSYYMLRFMTETEMNVATCKLCSREPETAPCKDDD